MAQVTMYAGEVGSPTTALSTGCSDSDTEITVDDASVLPTAPNLLTLGTTSSCEVCKYTSISGDVVTIARSGDEHRGTAAAWAEGTTVGRFFTSYDYDAFKGNIEDLDTVKAPYATVAASGPTGPATGEFWFDTS